MNIAIIGAGAIGSVVAANLTKAEVDVVLIGREEQVSVINKNGLTLKKSSGDENITVRALTKLDKEYDLVIFCTKTQDLEEAYQHNCEFLEECFVLSSQNGVQADTILSSHFYRDKMLSSIVMFGSTFIKPGEVTVNFEGQWIVGKPFFPIDPFVHEVIAILSKGFDVVASENITGMKYLKLFVNFNNCIPALIGKSMQETFADLDLCRLSNLLLREGIDVVKKANIEMVSLPNFPLERIEGLVNMPIDQASGILQKTLTQLSDEPLYGSILQSIMRGKPSEIDFINGEVNVLAHQMRFKTPLNLKIVEMVHEVERTKKYFDVEDVKKKFDLVAV
ncbi:hypothetical protein MNBD_BACTEROID05-215 [hydrothermal vent metagenome]|uniref:2-dehydropantoate 2-reductase n=1 Tax=hydrothermal vent metagenome TaxID=652676 RepID=A0A3B0T7F2_9ZZZZ